MASTKPGDLIQTLESLYFTEIMLDGVYRVCRPASSVSGLPADFIIPKGRVGLVVGGVGAIDDMVSVILDDAQVYAMFTRFVDVVQGIDDAS